MTATRKVVFKARILDDPEEKVFDVGISCDVMPDEMWKTDENFHQEMRQRACEGLVTSVSEMFQFADGDVIEVLLIDCDEPTMLTKPTQYSVRFIFQPSAMVVSH